MSHGQTVDTKRRYTTHRNVLINSFVKTAAAAGTTTKDGDGKEVEGVIGTFDGETGPATGSLDAAKTLDDDDGDEEAAFIESAVENAGESLPS